MLRIRVVSRLEVALFESLSVREQRVVAALSVVHEPIGEKALLEWLKLFPSFARSPDGASRSKASAASARVKAPAIDAEELAETLNALRSAGTIQALGSLHAPKYTVSVDLAHAALSSVRESEQLEAAVTLTMRRAPRVDPETRWLHRSRLVRDVLLSAHVGDGASAHAALRDLQVNEARPEDPAHLLFDALGVSPPAHAVSGLLPDERDAYALRAIEESLDTLAPLGDELAQLLREQASSLSALLLAALGFYDALCGNTSLHEELLRRPEPEVFATRAFIALTQSNVNAREQARSLARDAFELSRGATPAARVASWAMPVPGLRCS